MSVSRTFGPAERLNAEGVYVDLVWDVRLPHAGILERAVATLDGGGVIAIVANDDADILSALDRLLPLLGGGHV